MVSFKHKFCWGISMNGFKMWNMVSLLYWIRVTFLIWCMLYFFVYDQQGEAPIGQDLQNGNDNDFESKSGTFETSTIIGEKKVLIMQYLL